MPAGSGERLPAFLPVTADAYSRAVPDEPSSLASPRSRSLNNSADASLQLGEPVQRLAVTLGDVIGDRHSQYRCATQPAGPTGGRLCAPDRLATATRLPKGSG